MGYTHYFTQNQSVSDEMWALILRDVRKLVDNSPVPLASRDGEGEPEFADKYFSFNGVAPDDDHEPFALAQNGSGFSFCKTAHKPYDVVVTASLIVADHHAPGVWDIGSDGGAGAWEEGLEFARTTLSFDFQVPSRFRDEIA